MDKEAGVTPDKENTFETIRQQIEIEIDSARKFFDNRLFHRALQRYETALRLANRLQEEDLAQLGELGELVYNVEVQRSIIFLLLDNPLKVIEISTRLLDSQYCQEGRDTSEVDRLLGLAYYMSEQHREAIPYLNRVEQAWCSWPEQERDTVHLMKLAQLMRTNALAHLYRLFAEEAIDKLYQARELLVDVQAKSQLADCDTLLGEISLYFQEYRSARFHIGTALNLHAQAGMNIKLAQCLWLQARLERAEGNRDRAFLHYQEARQFYTGNDQIYPALLILIEQAGYHGELAEYDLARERFLEAEDLSRFSSDFSQLQSLLKLRRCEFEYRMPGAVADVRDGFRELVRTLREQNNSYMLHNTILNMLLIELEHGDPSLAEEWVSELNNFFTTIRGMGFPFAPVISSRILIRDDKLHEAEHMLLRVIQDMKTQGIEQFLCLYYQELADIQYHESNNAIQAQESLKAAMDLAEGDRFLFKTPFLRNLFHHFYRDPHTEYMDFLLETGNTSSLLTVLERKIVNDLRQSFGADIGHRLMPEGLSIPLQRKWDSLGTLSKRLLHTEGMLEYSLPYDCSPVRFFHEHEADFDIQSGQHDVAREGLESIMKMREKDYAALETVRGEIVSDEPRWRHIMTAFDSRSRIQDSAKFQDQTFLAYVVGEERSYGVLIVKGEVNHAFTIPLPRLQLNEMISHVRLEISHAKYPRKFRATLWELLIEPVIDRIPERTERLVIIPHDFLWRLPLHLMEKKGEFLWDRFCIEYSPSLSLWDMARSRGDERKRKSFHCFAHIVPGVSDQLSDLSGLEQLSHVKRSSDEFTLLSEGITTQRFWQNVRQSHIVIIGTLLNAYAGTPSAIWFNCEGHDSLSHPASLSLDDVIEKKLPDTDIVIFPSVSMEADQSKSFHMPALMHQAWLCAGVPTMLYSLWPADPVAVSMFITSFLKNKSRMSIAQALRSAALDLRDSGDFSSVRDWAPLTFCGYGGALGRESKRGLFFRR